MDTASLVASIDAEIARLQQARAVLTGGPGKTAKAPKKAAKRKLSAEARNRIADAQRKRWAATKAKK